MTRKSLIEWLPVGRDGTLVSMSDRFMILERWPGQWRAIDWEAKEAVYTTSVEEAKDWCDQQLGKGGRV